MFADLYASFIINGCLNEDFARKMHLVSLIVLAASSVVCHSLLNMTPPSWVVPKTMISLSSHNLALKL